MTDEARDVFPTRLWLVDADSNPIATIERDGRVVDPDGTDVTLDAERNRAIAEQLRAQEPRNITFQALANLLDERHAVPITDEARAQDPVVASVARAEAEAAAVSLREETRER